MVIRNRVFLKIYVVHQDNLKSYYTDLMTTTGEYGIVCRVSQLDGYKEK